MNLQQRFTARGAGLLVVDLQPRLLDQMEQGPLVTTNAARLISAARILSIPHWATEQNPARLGASVEPIARLIPERIPKMAFSCCRATALAEQLNGRGLAHIALVGVETHVCILQTAIDLLSMGTMILIPVDAVTSRNRLDHDIALRRLDRAGAVLTTTETLLFEWLEAADHPAFPQIRDLVKNVSPTANKD